MFPLLLSLFLFLSFSWEEEKEKEREIYIQSSARQEGKSAWFTALKIWLGRTCVRMYVWKVRTQRSAYERQPRWTEASARDSSCRGLCWPPRSDVVQKREKEVALFRLYFASFLRYSLVFVAQVYRELYWLRLMNRKSIFIAGILYNFYILLK